MLENNNNAHQHCCEKHIGTGNHKHEQAHAHSQEDDPDDYFYPEVGEAKIQSECRYKQQFNKVRENGRDYYNPYFSRRRYNDERVSPSSVAACVMLPLYFFKTFRISSFSTSSRLYCSRLN